jgi:hypothetical protein
VAAIATWRQSYDHLQLHTTRVARFFFVKRTKTGETIPNDHKYTKWLLNRQNGPIMDQMAIEYTNIPISLQDPSKFTQNWEFWFENLATLHTTLALYIVGLHYVGICIY